MYSPVLLLRYPIQMTRNKNTSKNGGKNSMQVIRFANVPKPKNKKKNSKQSVSTKMVVRAKPSATLSGGAQPMRGKLSLPQFTISQIDPFCPEAFGVKVPDDATAPSCVAFSRSEDFINTSTVGGGGLVFRYHPISAVVGLTAVTATTWSVPLTFGGSISVSNGTALQTNFSTLRVVAHGIKITTRQSAFAASGFVHVALVGDNMTYLPTWDYPTSVSAMEYSPYYRRIPISDLIEDEILVVNKFTDRAAFRYIDHNHGDNNTGFGGTLPSYTYGYATTGWMAIVVWVEGPASVVAAVDIESIRHYECMSQAATGIISITKAAPNSPAIMAATSYAVEHSEPISVVREDEDNIGPFWKDVSQLFSTGLRVANGVVQGVKTVTGLMSNLIV